MSSKDSRETRKNAMKEKQKDSRLKLINKLRDVSQKSQTEPSPKNRTKKSGQDRYQMLLKWREERKLKEQESKKIERKNWNSSKNLTSKNKVQIQNEKSFIPDPAFSTKPFTQFSNLNSNDLVRFTGKGNSKVLKEANTRITRSSTRKIESESIRNKQDNTKKYKETKNFKGNKSNFVHKKIDKTNISEAAMKNDLKIEASKSMDTGLRRSNRLKKDDKNVKTLQQNQTTRATKKNYAQTKEKTVQEPMKVIESKVSKKISCQSVRTRSSCKVSSQENVNKEKNNINKKLIVNGIKDKNISKEYNRITIFKNQKITLKKNEKSENMKCIKENRSMNVDEEDMKGDEEIITVNKDDNKVEEIVHDVDSKSDAVKAENITRCEDDDRINNEEIVNGIENELDYNDKSREISICKDEKKNDNINIERDTDSQIRSKDQLTDTLCEVDTNVKSNQDVSIEISGVDNETLSLQQRKANGTFFEKLMDEKKQHFDERISYWNNVASQSDFPKEGESHVRCTVGMAQLLMRERFQQFKGLVDAHVTGKEQIPSRKEDLQGFWEMVLCQVSDIETKFNQLEDLQKNNWLEKISCVEEKKKIVPTKKILKTKTSGPSKLSQFLAEKKRQKELQKKQGDNDNHLTNDCNDVATFDGGFFRVDSPIKNRKRSSPIIQACEISMHTTPRTKVLRVKNDHCYGIPTAKRKQLESFNIDSTVQIEKIEQPDFDTDNELKTKTPTKSLVKRDHCYVIPTEKRNLKMTDVFKDDSVSQKLDWSLMDDENHGESPKNNGIYKENRSKNDNVES